MYIIFGKEQANALSEKHTVLELDTIKLLPSGDRVTAYAVVESIAIPDMPMIETRRNLHNELMENYRKRDWNFCDQAIEQLVGAWSGELDSFYSELQSRINNYAENDPGESWDPVIEKTLVADSPQS